MAFVPPKTWVSGEKLDAGETLQNLDALKQYTQNTDSASYSAGAFIESKHIVRPFIDSTRNASHNVSGFYCSQTDGGLYAAGSFISRFESAQNAKQIIPKTSVILPLCRAANIFYQYWGVSESRFDNSGVRGNYYCYAYVSYPNNVSAIIAEAPAYRNQSRESENNKPLALSGRSFINVHRSTVAASGQNLIIGVSGFGSCNVQFVSWGFTVECWYM